MADGLVLEKLIDAVDTQNLSFLLILMVTTDMEKCPFHIL